MSVWIENENRNLQAIFVNIDDDEEESTLNLYDSDMEIRVPVFRSLGREGTGYDWDGIARLLASGMGGGKAARCISILKQECSLFMGRQVFFWSWRKNCKESFLTKRNCKLRISDASQRWLSRIGYVRGNCLARVLGSAC